MEQGSVPGWPLFGTNHEDQHSGECCSIGTGKHRIRFGRAQNTWKGGSDPPSRVRRCARVRKPKILFPSPCRAAASDGIFGHLLPGAFQTSGACQILDLAYGKASSARTHPSRVMDTISVRTDARYVSQRSSPTYFTRNLLSLCSPRQTTSTLRLFFNSSDICSVAKHHGR